MKKYLLVVQTIRLCKTMFLIVIWLSSKVQFGLPKKKSNQIFDFFWKSASQKTLDPRLLFSWSQQMQFVDAYY